MISFLTIFHFLQSILSFQAEADLIVGDPLDQWYVVKDSEVEKHSTDGKIIHVYSAPSLGPVEFLDVSNPLKPFVFYPELGKIVFLNTMMAPIEPSVDLFQMDGQFTAACGSVDQHVWLYDTNTQSLKRYDQFLNEAASTGSLRTWVVESWTTRKMAEFSGEVFVWNGKDKLLVFDLFGTYKRELHTSEPEQLHFTSDGWIERKNGEAIFYPYQQFKEAIPLYSSLDDHDKLAISAKYIARYNGQRVLLEKGRVLKP